MMVQLFCTIIFFCDTLIRYLPKNDNTVGYKSCIGTLAGNCTAQINKLIMTFKTSSLKWPVR